MSSFIGFAAFLLLKAVSSYNLTWSAAYQYFSGGTRSPYLIYLRGSDPEYLLLCFEEIVDDDFSGICETGQLDITNNQIIFGAKAMFKEQNAANPYEIQLFDNGPTNYFLLGFTNGAFAAEGPGQILMGSYSATDGSLTYGDNTYTFNPYLNDQTHIIELQNNSYFVVCASAGPNNQYDTACRIGQYDIDTLSINIGTKIFNMTQNHPTRGMGTQRIDSTSFLACFAAYYERIGVCYVGTVIDDLTNGLESNIEFGNEIIFNDDGMTDDINIIRANQTVWIICYGKSFVGGDGYGECKFAVLQTLSNGRPTISIQNNAFDYEIDRVDSPSIFRVRPNSLSPNLDNPELIGVCYVDDSNGQCRFGVVDLDNLSIKFDDRLTNPFDQRNVGGLDTIYLGQETDGTNKIVICYTRFSGSTPLFNSGICKYGTITDEE